MKNRILAILALAAALCTASAYADTFEIATAADWATFAGRVNNGERSLDAKMTADVMLTQDSPRVGTDSRKYSGNFDGAGHVLTLNWVFSGVENAAPFAFVAGCNIHDLRTAGTISSDEAVVSGLIGSVRADDSTEVAVVSRCCSSVQITSRKTGDAAAAGLLGTTYWYSQTIQITDCLFDGSLLGADATDCGGFAGFNFDATTLQISNSLFAPYTVTVLDDGSATFSRHSSSAGAKVQLQGCYYMQTLGTAQGTDASSMSAEDLVAALGENWTVVDGKAMLKVFAGSTEPSTITFVSEGNTVGTAVAKNGFALPAAPEVTKETYCFLGYFTEETGGTKVYNADLTPTLGSWYYTGEVTLYAHWEPTHALTFVSDGSAVGTVVYRESDTANAPIPQRVGDYTFLGYCTEDGQQIFDGSGTLVPGSLSGLASTATLRAQWLKPAGSVARLVYRGQLTKLGGSEAPDSEGSYTKTMQFKVYDGESAETPVWTSESQNVTVNKDGSFMVTFGDDALAEMIATGSVTHVAVAIGSSAIEMKPRRAIRPVAAVNRALVAEGAGKDPRIGNLVTENALAANNVTVSRLEVDGTVTAPGAGPVTVSPVVVGERETLTLLRGGGVNVFSKKREDLGTTGSVMRGQKIGTKAAPSDGIALITSLGGGSRGLRIPGVIQYCRKGEWVRAPATEPAGVKVTFFPFAGK